MNQPTPDETRGPYMLLPDGRLGHLSSKFPDKGSWPYWWPLESFFREQAYAVSAISMARYTVALFDPSQQNGVVFTATGKIRWHVPAHLMDNCPVPIILAVVNKNPGVDDIWTPLHVEAGLSISFYETDQKSGMRGMVEATGTSGWALKAALIFPPYKTEDFKHTPYMGS